MKKIYVIKIEILNYKTSKIRFGDPPIFKDFEIYIICNYTLPNITFELS